ncbi:MAG TPA: universal stress protein [Alphaproteobacteria bacterium]|nr:universal stress protein [Alphaproteobacteria bacterium]
MTEPARHFRRILVALDDSEESRAAVETASTLARRLEAELIGLFVEDIRFLELAEHPVVRHFSLTKRRPLTPDTRDMERGLKAQAEAARRTLVAAAERQHVRWSFSVARGRVAVEVLSMAPEADLIVLGKTSLSGAGRARLGSTARALAVSDHGTVLFSEMRFIRGLSIEGPVLAAYDRAGPADAVLTVASRVANRDGGRLLVLLPALAKDEAEALRAHARNILQGAPIEVTFHTCPGAGCAELNRAVTREGVGLLVVGEGSALLGGERVSDLIERVRVPVLLVRQPRSEAA